MQKWLRASVFPWALILLLLLGCKTEVIEDRTVDDGPPPPDLTARPWGLAATFLERVKSHDYEGSLAMTRGEVSLISNESAFTRFAELCKDCVPLQEETRGRKATVVVGLNQSEPKYRLLFSKSYGDWKIEEIKRSRKS